MNEGPDYETPAAALAAAIDYISNDGGRAKATHRLAEVTFGRRNELVAGGGYWWTARYQTEVTNGQERMERQSTVHQVAMAVGAFEQAFEIAERGA